MAGYSYTKGSVHSSWLVTITLKESVHSLHDWLQLHLKKCSLFMAGYNYTKRSVHSLHDIVTVTLKEVFTLHGWLQLH